MLPTGSLFSRHKDAASRLAKQLVRGPDADDLVSEAFAKVLTVLQGGGGPDVAFRAYLLTAVRRLHVDRVRAGQRLQTTDDMTPFDPGVPFKDTAVAGFESGAAAQAFASLPERWQLVLWHLEVEGQKPADIAPLLGMSANSVSALAYRAREGLRQAFLTMHLSDISETDCRWVNEHLGAFVRKGLSKRDATKVQNHLDGCRRCTAMYLELADVNSNLAGIIGPLLLGAAAAGYLASSGAGIGAGGVVSLMSRTKDFVAANSGAVAAGAVATGVAAAAVAAVVVTQVGNGNSPDVVANPPASATSGLTSGASPGASSSTNPSASGSPGASAPTPTLTSSASPSTTTTASSLPSSLTTPSAGLALLPEVLGTEAATDLPSAGASETAPGGGPTDEPSGGPTTEPPPTEPPPPGLAALTIDGNLDPDSGNGSVLVQVSGLSTGAQVGISMQSDHTTFAAPPDDCTLPDDRNVTCLPLGEGGRTAAAADTSDFTVRLPLDFHDLTVPDDITITVTVDGKQVGVATTQSVTPQLDLAMPDISGPDHTVAGDVDRYDFTATPALPPGVTGLRFHLTGDARFRSAGADPCSVGGADDKTLTCPDAARGKSLTLPVAADGLTAPTDISFDVETIGIGDPSSGNNSSDPVTLAPGAALDLLDLGVLTSLPDQNGLVTLNGTLGGIRKGMNGVTYHLMGGAATFDASRNPGCKVGDDGTSLRCDEAGSKVSLVVVVPPDVRHQPNQLDVVVTPNDPFVLVGDANTASVVISGRPEHDFSLSGLQADGHQVDGDTDVYRVTGTVGPLPDDVNALDFTVKGASVPEQPDGRCSRIADDELRCTGLDNDPTPTFTLTETGAKAHDVTVTVQPADPYDDPESVNNDSEITVQPGANLTLASAAGGPVSQQDGVYQSAVRLGGVRDGLPSVFLDLGPGATFTQKPPACTYVSSTRLQCNKPANGEIPIAVVADDAAHPTALSVTATPGGDFEQLSGGNVADLTLRAIHDFSIGDLTKTAQSVSGDTDSYTLHTTIGSYPSGVGPLTYAVTGGRFATTQDDCTYVDANHVTCGDGPVDLAVQSTSTDAHDVTVSLQTPAGYDDPDADNDSSTVSVQPGVDLSLADLDPDNESPANDDRTHRVASHLDGVRPGMGSVTYTLQGDATFEGASVAGCTASGKTLVCDDPKNGDITFTVRAASVEKATPITIAVSAPKAFLELNDADNADSVTLLPRPTYNFSMGALDTSAHSVDGDTDHYTIGSTVGAVPNGAPWAGFHGDRRDVRTQPGHRVQPFGRDARDVHQPRVGATHRLPGGLHEPCEPRHRHRAHRARRVRRHEPGRQRRHRQRLTRHRPGHGCADAVVTDAGR